MAGALAVYLIIREVTGDRRALPVYLLVVSFAGIGSTYSVSGRPFVVESVKLENHIPSNSTTPRSFDCTLVCSAMSPVNPL